MQTADQSRLESSERERIVVILRAHGIVRAGVFGSFARGDQRASSDLDLLIEPQAGTTLLDLARLELALEDLLSRHVDLVTYEELHPAICDQALQEQEALL